MTRVKIFLLVLRYLAGVSVALLLAWYIEANVDSKPLKWILEFLAAGLLISIMSGQLRLGIQKRDRPSAGG